MANKEIKKIKIGEETYDVVDDRLKSQTAYSAKGSATKVPQITTNALGQVTGITEVDINNTDETIKLSEDLSVYTNVGLITASATSPVKVGNAGDSIKSVFQTMFVGQDSNPTVYIPTLSASLNPNAGYTYALTYGEKLPAPKYTITYNNATSGDITGYYQYKSIENTSSTSAGLAVSASSFTVGTGSSITGTISNTDKTQTLTGPEIVVPANTTGISQKITGTLTFNLSNVKTARTKLGKKASAAASGSNGTLNASTGKISNTSIQVEGSSAGKTVYVKGNDTSPTTKPSGTITLTNAPGGTYEVGTTVNFTAKIASSNTAGKYAYGYFTNGTGTRNTSTSAGCSLSGLTLKNGTSSIASQISDDGVDKQIQATIKNGSNNGTISGSLTFNCDTTRHPASHNYNIIDVSIKDYRVNGSTATYTPSVTNKTWSATGKYYAYYIVTSSASAPTNNWNRDVNDSATSSNGLTLDASGSKYIYIACESSTSYSKIQSWDPLNNRWIDIDSTTGTISSFSLASGATASYKWFRTKQLNDAAYKIKLA